MLRIRLKTMFKLKFVENLPLYDLLLVYVGIVGIANVTLLAIGWFRPVVSLLVGLFIVGVFLLVSRPKVIFKDARFGWPVLSLLLLALVFRLPPYLYLMGGQDQGTYVNISKVYEEQGTLYYTDHFRETLTEEQKKLYDEYGNYMMPSFEKWNRDGSEYTMKFYPMHPSFMAIFGKVFGSDNRVYSLTFFSLISLANIYLITSMLGKSRKAGLIALLLLALNPLHAFFSKMPVGEITALAFSSAGFYFLIRFFEEFGESLIENMSGNKLWNTLAVGPAHLYLSALMFFGFMYVRVTFFIYLILLLLILLGVIVYTTKKLLWAYFGVYTAFLFILTAVSYAYYFTFLWPLYDLMFNSTIVRGLKRIFFLSSFTVGQKIVFIIGACAIGIFVAAFIKQKLYTVVSKNLRAITLTCVVVLLFFFLDSLIVNIKNYLLLGIAGISTYSRWNISENAINAVKSVILFSIVNHISVVGFVLYLFYFISAFFTKKLDTKVFISFFIFSFFLVFYSLSLKYMRYDYYNSRYYLTEVVPAFVVFVSLYLFSFIENKSNLSRIVAYSLFVTIGLYYLIFSSVQFLGPESVNNDFYSSLTKLPGNTKLIVLINNFEANKYQTNFNMYALAPMKYYYDGATLVWHSEEILSNADFKQLARRFDKVYVISNMDTPESVELGLLYSHYNNGIGCGLHNYEFLQVDRIQEVYSPSALRCITLPTAYFTRTKVYSLYAL